MKSKQNPKLNRKFLCLLVQFSDTSVQIIDEVGQYLCNFIVKLGKQLEILVSNCDSSAERFTLLKINQ